MNFGGNVNLGNGLGPNMSVSLGKKIETPGASGSMEIPKNEAQPVDLFGIGASRDAVNQAQASVADWRQVVNSAIMNRAMVRKGYASMERIQKNEAYIALGIAALGQAFGARAQYATGGANNYLQGVQAINQQNYQDANIQNELNYQNEVNLRNAELSQAQLGLEGAQGDLAFAQKGYLQKEQTLMDMAENEQKAIDAQNLAVLKSQLDAAVEQAKAEGNHARLMDLKREEYRLRLLENSEKANNDIAKFNKWYQRAIEQGYDAAQAWEFATKMEQPSQVLSPYQQGQLDQKAREFDYQKSQDELDREDKRKTEEYNRKVKAATSLVGTRKREVSAAQKEMDDLLDFVKVTDANEVADPNFWAQWAILANKKADAEKALEQAQLDLDDLINNPYKPSAGDSPWAPGALLPLPSGFTPNSGSGPPPSGTIGNRGKK